MNSEVMAYIGSGVNVHVVEAILVFLPLVWFLLIIAFAVYLMFSLRRIRKELTEIQKSIQQVVSAINRTNQNG